jgi:hypothetical protein
MLSSFKIGREGKSIRLFFYFVRILALTTIAGQGKKKWVFGGWGAVRSKGLKWRKGDVGKGGFMFQ